MKIDNWIFVTGMPRSGTTFVGKMLSASIKVDYIHEPANPIGGVPGIDRRFLYLRPGSEESLRYEKHIEKIFTYKFSLRTRIYPKDNLLKRLVKRIVGSRGPFYLRLAKLNPWGEAAVIKCPSSCLITEYLANRFGVKPVVLIRHPVAVVASFVRIELDHGLENIRQQKELVDDYFQDEREFLSKDGEGRVESTARLWRALNKVVLTQAERNPQWHVITHESLCQDPLSHFRNLYSKLDLPWSRRIERRIINHTSAKNRVEAARGRVQDFKRNSARLFEHRLKMIPKDQRRKIFEITKDVALKIYPEESFALE